MTKFKRNDSASTTLKYLEDLSRKRPGPVLSGVHTPEGADELHEATGHFPVIVGIEYCFAYGTQPVDSPQAAVPWRDLNPFLIEHGQAGSLIRVLTHFPNPTKPSLGGLRDRDADITLVLKTGTRERERWLALLDEVAAGFKDLAKHGITVIYGPLHEMNCNGFWWGLDHPQNSPEAFRALWHDIVSRIRDHHQCDNVLWLWAPLAMTPVVPAAYPGDETVDIVGLDVYDATLAPYVDAYASVSNLGKPFVISEYGPGKWDMTEPPDPPYDCQTLMREIHACWPAAVGFMFWGGCFLPSRQRFAQEMMDDALVMDRRRFKADIH